MIGRFLERTWVVLAFTGATGFIAAIAVTSIDMVGRIVGVTLFRGAIDVVVISMVLAGAFAVAIAEWRDANVRVEPLSAWIPVRLRRFADAFWHLVWAVLLAAISWRSASEALMVHGFGEVLPALRISIGWLGLLVCVGFGFGAGASFAAALRRLRGGPAPNDAATPSDE